MDYKITWIIPTHLVRLSLQKKRMLANYKCARAKAGSAYKLRIHAWKQGFHPYTNKGDPGEQYQGQFSEQCLTPTP